MEKNSHRHTRIAKHLFSIRKKNRVTVSTSISAHVLWGSRFHDGANEGLRVVLAPPAKFRYTGRTYAKEDLSLRESERGVVG